MDMTISISPDDLKNWPVLDEKPEEGIVTWLEFDEDFLGHRVKVKFPRWPTFTESAQATNVPITLVCLKNKIVASRFLWKKTTRVTGWNVAGFHLWTEKEGGKHLARGVWDDGSVTLYASDKLILNNFIFAIG
jgi:hypothetical protein